MTNEEARIELLEEYKIFLEGCGLENEEYLNQQMKDNDELRKVVEANRMAIKALEQQPCEDAISRADILDAIETWDKFGVNAEQKLIRWQDHYVPYVHLDDVRNAIANMPSVTPKPKTGHWIVDVDRWGDVVTTVNGYRCDKCSAFNSDKDNYCPNCGADMRGDSE